MNNLNNLRLTNHAPDDCNYKDSECSKCHLTGHLQSECGMSLSKKLAGKQYISHTDQNSEEGGPEGTRGEFLGSIFNL